MCCARAAPLRSCLPPAFARLCLRAPLPSLPISLSLLISSRPLDNHQRQGYGDQRFVFEGVGGTIRYGPGDRPFAPGEPRVSCLVLIGRGLDRRSLARGFRTCAWQPLPAGWRQAFDPVTRQPYYYAPALHRKTWARPQAPAAAAAAAAGAADAGAAAAERDQAPQRRAPAAAFAAAVAAQ